MQPRVSAALPLGAEGSVYQRIFSSPGGIEPYAAATSDLYQDVFGEGSFTGKGIYDVDAFEAALAGRVPDNAMLSHDLFEGVFARAALASDVEVIEDFPTRYGADRSRHHRWARGDWQLLPWIFGKRRHADGGVPAVGRSKMIDNLRRSLLAPMVLATLLAGWLSGPAVSVLWTVWVLLMLALPRLLPLPFGIVPTRTGVTLHSHLAALAKDTLTALTHVALVVVFLLDSAAVMLDAIVRTIWRQAVSRRHLLEGANARASQVIYDRLNDSFCTLEADSFDWERILTGADWFHFTGITPALSESAAQACLEAVQTARKLGVKISADVYYRKGLWNWGKTPQEIMPELVSYCDLIVCGNSNADDLFGIKPLSEDKNKWVSTSKQIMEKYPNIKLILDTKRDSVSASHNQLKGKAWNGEKFYKPSNISAPCMDSPWTGKKKVLTGFLIKYSLMSSVFSS